MEKTSKKTVKRKSTSKDENKLTTAQKNSFIRELSKKVNRNAYLRMMEDLIMERKS